MNLSFFFLPEGALQDGSEADGFDAQIKSYRKRLEERKRVRGVLNTCGLKQDWLRNKDDRTKLENRVLKRLLQKQRPEIAIKEVI